MGQSCCSEKDEDRKARLATDLVPQDPPADRPPPQDRQNQAFSVVYIEHEKDSEDCCTTGADSSLNASSKASAMNVRVMQTSVNSLCIHQTKLDSGRLQQFKEHLRKGGIDTSQWGVKGRKSVEHLFWEVYEQRGCVIVGLGTDKLKRVTRLVKINLVAEIFGVEHILQSRMQFQHDGQIIERLQVPLRKLLWTTDANSIGDPDNNMGLRTKDCPYTEDWRNGVTRALQDRLGLNLVWQQSHLEEDVHAAKFCVEDDVQSDGYPGLNTMYCIHQMTFRVLDSAQAGVQCIGLPQGQEFATAEGDFNFNSQDEQSGLSIGTQLNIWTWRRVESSKRIANAKEGPGAAPGRPQGSKELLAHQLIKRVPLHKESAQALANLQARLAVPSNPRAPNATLWAAMEHEKTDWAKVKKIAKRIADPKYTLKMFYEDLAAFPELNLYLLEKSGPTGALKDGVPAEMTGSGRTIGDEYQRTVGAFFAIYWLFRLAGDGKDGFSFGVDDNWVPISQSGVNDRTLYPADKRLKFRADGHWNYFRRLLIDAKLLSEDRWGRTKINESRLVSLLALTAVHDIMKMDRILPQVQAQHAPYNAYAAGDTIGDHDHALGYVMQHYPDLLPSFKGLAEADRGSVKFTQCNLQFNHGWFVQAEAPPGAIFTNFRNALIREHKGSIGPADVAFYFVHWLTDLAGAEPTPRAGCEKFVAKFPLQVLNSFVRSFEYVEKIANSTETQVVEQYLKMRWTEADLGEPIPMGASAIAKMRLLCMAQTNASVIVRAYDALDESDVEVLNFEMALTGCLSQNYSPDLCPTEAVNQPCGPAFLVYYGPAFLQNLGADPPAERLSLLAEVYRCARVLWPATVSKTASTVTIRIDTIKALSLKDMRRATMHGDMWLMVKHNEAEAFIELSSKKKLNRFIANKHSIQIVDLRRHT